MFLHFAATTSLTFWILVSIALTVTVVLGSLEHAASLEDQLELTGRKLFQQEAVDDAQSEEEFGCNTVLATIPAGQIQEFLNTAVDEKYGEASAATALLKATISTRSIHGIQVRRVCSSCQDFEDTIDHPDYQRYCGPQVYGYNQTFSGLLVLPLSQDGSADFQPGTLPGLIWAHPTIVNTPPSTSYVGTSSSAETLTFGFLPASMGIPAIMPDYFGYGVSNAKVYKGYVIRQSYEASIVPIWYMAARILREESNCRTELANALTLTGYSEGGYVGPVIATALHKLGWNIIKVHAGATPAKVGSALMPGLLQSVALGVYPPAYADIFMLLGSSYSSTYRDIANFGKGQDVVKPELRDAVIDLVNRAPGRADLINFLGDDWLRIFDDDFLAWGRDIYESGDPNPCVTRFEPGFNDFICPAFTNNDITELLETTPFPIQMCHSVDDEVVVFENLPNFAKNENLTLLAVTGTHLEAGFPCLTTATLYLTTPAFQAYPIQAKHSVNGCPTSSHSPTSAPSFVEQSSSSPTVQYISTLGPTSTGPSNADTVPPTSGGSTNSFAGISLLPLACNVVSMLVFGFV
jgi:hypothetical protein